MVTNKLIQVIGDHEIRNNRSLKHRILNYLEHVKMFRIYRFIYNLNYNRVYNIVNNLIL